ncbi:MAG TPA: DUF4124 domain-containing protein [Candidatus Acidoferrales bacterium]|nr:DUF4124 domain-containing protein [Candidatus Acidoferrales bacterium]
MGRSRFLLFLLVGCTLVGRCAITSAQTFYKWTDDAGVVHFSDEPPPDMKGVEERNLAVEPVVKSGPESPDHPSDAAAAGGGAKEPGAPNAPKAEGPARVVLVSRQNPRIGPSAMHVIGQVKNVGGANARRVSVTISAVDATQGTPCLNEEASVTPSTLKPGETGNFDVDLNSPCLLGEPNLDVAPVWD